MEKDTNRKWHTKDFSEFTFNSDKRYGATWAGELVGIDLRLRRTGDLYVRGVRDLMITLFDIPNICNKIVNRPTEIMTRVAMTLAASAAAPTDEEILAESLVNFKLQDELVTTVSMESSMQPQFKQDTINTVNKDEEIPTQVVQMDLEVSPNDKGMELYQNIELNVKELSIQMKNIDVVAIDTNRDSKTIEANFADEKTQLNINRKKKLIDAIKMMSEKVQALNDYENEIKPDPKGGVTFGRYFTLWLYRCIYDEWDGLNEEGCCSCEKQTRIPGEWLRKQEECTHEDIAWLRGLHELCSDIFDSGCGSCKMRWLAVAMYGATGKFDVRTPNHFVTILAALVSNAAEIMTVDEDTGLTNEQLVFWLMTLGVAKEMRAIEEVTLDIVAIEELIALISERIRIMMEAEFAINCPSGVSRMTIMLREPFIGVMAYEGTVNLLEGMCEGVCTCNSAEIGDQISDSMDKSGVREWIDNHTTIFGGYNECAIAVSHVQAEGVMQKAGIHIAEYMANTIADGHKVWLDICQTQEFNPHLCRHEYLRAAAVVSKNILTQQHPYVCLSGLLLSRWMSRGWTFQEAALPRVLFAITIKAGAIKLRSGSEWCVPKGRLTKLLDEVMPWEQEWSPVVLAGLQRRAWRRDDDIFKVLSLSLGHTVNDLKELCQHVDPGHVATMAVTWDVVGQKGAQGECWMPYNPPVGVPTKTRLMVADFLIIEEGLRTVAILGAKSKVAAMNMLNGISTALVGTVLDLVLVSEDSNYGVLPVVVTSVSDDKVVTLHKVQSGYVTAILPTYAGISQAAIVLGLIG